MPSPSVEPWLLDAARQRVYQFADQLRTGVDGAAGVPNLDWTVSDLAQHVAALPSYWRDQHEAGSTFERPTDFAAFSNEARAIITETRPPALAEVVTSEFDSFLDEMAASSSDRWLYGRPTNPTNMCGITLNELIQHGQDLAQISGADAPMFNRREANAAVAAMMMATPAFIDEAKASAQPDGQYHVHFRGGKHYTWTKTGGELVIAEGRPDRADARLSADPATFLLVSLGRIGQVRASVTGKMLAYGRRPWRFLGLGTMAVDGV